MAITNAQQYKQLLANGGRIGLKGGADAATESFAKSYDKAVGNKPGTTKGRPDKDFNPGTGGGGPTFGDAPATTVTGDDVKKAKKEYEKQFYDKGQVPPLGSRPTSLKTKLDQRNKQKRLDYINRLITNRRKKIIDAIELAGIEGVTEENFDELYNKGMLNIPSVADLVEQGFYKSDGPFATGEKIPGITSMRPPGALGLLTKPFESPLTTEGIDKLLQENIDLKNLRTTEGLEGTTFNELMETYEPNRFKLQNPEPGGGPDQQMDPCKGPNPPAYCFVDPPSDPTDPSTPSTGVFAGIAPRFAGSIFDFDALRAGAMDGGIMNNKVMGGMADGNIDEAGRQMYFLGKLVKKATRAVKKVAKSPFGKAALLGLGAYGLGGGFGAGGFKFGNFTKPGGFLSKILTKGGDKALSFDNLSLGKTTALGLGIPFALDMLGVGKDDDDKMDLDEYYRTQGINVADIRLNPYKYLSAANQGSLYAADGGLMRMGYQEGGDAEPVAKKTMPLIDMDGQEKDYRETGGFVDMGRMERADDVPARLSKNEFVFTADAVRNAGEGDIDKGAEVMYNMMKNLESGGDVSEESQGLDGAREMFQTSQRLEEVL